MAKKKRSRQQIRNRDAISLSEDLKTMWDWKESRWVLYHRDIDEDSRFRNNGVRSLTIAKNVNELTIKAPPNTGTHQRYERTESRGIKKTARSEDRLERQDYENTKAGEVRGTTAFADQEVISARSSCREKKKGILGAKCVKLEFDGPLDRLWKIHRA